MVEIKLSISLVKYKNEQEKLHGSEYFSENYKLDIICTELSQ